MILDKEVKIMVDPKSDRTYYKLGYYDRESVSKPFELVVKIEDLTKTSKVLVKVKCDAPDCPYIVMVSYYNYNENIKNHDLYTCSMRCSSIKNKLTCEEKYGDPTFNNNEKRKSTCIEIYGVDNCQKNEEIKKKTQETIEKTGGYGPRMEKVRDTNFKLYGKRHVLQVPEFLEKADNTRFERYGDKDYNNSKKREETCINLYGVDNIQKSEYMKNKKKEKIMKLHPDIISVSDDFVYTLKCDFGKDHIFEILPEQLYERKLSKTIVCTVCNEFGSSKSGQEILFFHFIEENYNGIILKDKRTTIKPKELDVCLPDIKLAYEYNGLFYHDETYCENDYHLMKTERCEEIKIQLTHVFSNDWLYKSNIVKSNILNQLNKLPNKIDSINCVVKEIKNNAMIQSFLTENHLQGHIESKIKLGLFYKDELVSIMTFKKTKKDCYELLRFCNKNYIDVIDSEKIQFNYFKTHFKPTEVITIVDRSWSNGKIFTDLEFTLDSIISPDYKYVIDDFRVNKSEFTHDKLVVQGFDPNKTEHEIMFERGIYRIYDSGSLKFVYHKSI